MCVISMGGMGGKGRDQGLEVGSRGGGMRHIGTRRGCIQALVEVAKAWYTSYMEIHP